MTAIVAPELVATGPLKLGGECQPDYYKLFCLCDSEEKRRRDDDCAKKKTCTPCTHARTDWHFALHLDLGAIAIIKKNQPDHGSRGAYHVWARPTSAHTYAMM